MGQLYTISRHTESRLPASRRISFQADDGEKPSAASLAPSVLDQLFVSAVDEGAECIDFSFWQGELKILCDGRLFQALPSAQGDAVIRRLRLLAGVLTRPMEQRAGGTVSAKVDGRHHDWRLETLDGPWGRALRVTPIGETPAHKRNAFAMADLRLRAAAV